MKSVFYCLSGPAGHPANEIVDAIAVSAVFDQPVAVAFIGDGVWQLFDQTDAEKGKNTTKFLSALPTFDISEFMVERESLQRQNLVERFNEIRASDETSFLNHVEITDIEAIRSRMRDFDMVVTD
ncbi:MAG: DsrE family protein [Gammaproteobacteria bacterium]|nr:DsrE family protein [Gammaproteobacteria bacterium]